MDIQQLICELESLKEIYKPKIENVKIEDDGELKKKILNNFHKLPFYGHTNKIFMTYEDIPYCQHFHFDEL